MEDYHLDANYKIYKIYGDLSMEKTNSILVGYDTTDFVVSDGKDKCGLNKGKYKGRKYQSTTSYHRI